MTRCLVTGHKGYIGSHLYAALKAQGHEVIGVDTDDSDSGRIQDVFFDPKQRKIFDVFVPEVIFHLACWPRVAFSVEQPIETTENNVLSTSVILDFANKINCSRVVYSSSSAIVGNGDGPESPYAFQKLASELEMTLYSRLYGVDTVSLRYFNVYSADQRADGPYATAVANWMEHLRQHKNPFITGDGSQRRDMLHVDDVISANIFAMNYEEKFAGRSFDIGTGTNISLNEMKTIVLEHLPETEFDYTTERLGDVRETKANTELIKELGWSAKIDAVKGIHECFKSFKESQNDNLPNG